MRRKEKLYSVLLRSPKKVVLCLLAKLLWWKWWETNEVAGKQASAKFLWETQNFCKCFARERKVSWGKAIFFFCEIAKALKYNFYNHQFTLASYELLTVNNFFLQNLLIHIHLYIFCLYVKFIHKKLMLIYTTSNVFVAFT